SCAKDAKGREKKNKKTYVSHKDLQNWVLLLERVGIFAQLVRKIVIDFTNRCRNNELSNLTETKRRPFQLGCIPAYVRPVISDSYSTSSVFLTSSRKQPFLTLVNGAFSERRNNTPGRQFPTLNL